MGLPAACLGLLLGAAAADPSAAAAGLGWVGVDAHSLLQEWTKVARPHRHARQWDETDMLKRALLPMRRHHRNFEVTADDLSDLFGRFKEYNQALIISNTFTHFDVNGDKKLDRKEIDTLLYYLGKKMSDEKINQIMADLDHVIPDQMVQLSEFFFWFTWPTIESEENLKSKIKSIQDEMKARTGHRGLVAKGDSALDSVLDNSKIVALNSTDPETVLHMFGKFTQYSEVLRMMYFFKVYDLDWDLKMRQSEFVHLLKYLNMGNWTSADIDLLVDGLDVLKKDGEVELNEFLYWFTPAFTNIWEAAVRESISLEAGDENHSIPFNNTNRSDQVDDLMNQLNDLAASVENKSNHSNVSNASEQQLPDLMKELGELAAGVNETLKNLPQESLHELPRHTSAGSPSSKGTGKSSSRGFTQYKQALIIVNVFAHFDKDADDKLNRTEMVDVLAYFGEYWSSEQVDQLITDLDHVIADGAVQPSEFFWWFTSSDINQAKGLEREVENMKNHEQESLFDVKGRPFTDINDADIVKLDSDDIPAKADDVLAVFGRFSEYRESLKVLFFFHTFDLDQDRHIDTDEFSRLLQMLEPGSWNYEEAHALMYSLDTLTFDGRVALNEFFQWFTPTFRHDQEAAIHQAAKTQALMKQHQAQ